MSTYKGEDDCTDTILDFISGGVPGNLGGESGGNYNAVIGNARAEDPLAAYGLSSIYAIQRQLVADGRPSSAIGRYQIIRQTLQNCVKALDLSPSSRFTPQLQDRLAVYLLTGRGYKAWWRGALTDAEFAHGMSMEWASLPDPDNGGKSHYDGVGPNHAGTTLEAVYAMLANARSKIKGSGGRSSGVAAGAPEQAPAAIPPPAG